MNKFILALACLIAGAAITPNLAAHSLRELEGQLSRKEKYFQPVSQPAPGFTLSDPDGKSHSLSEWKGKVVVLWFIYTSCTDVCPLHTNEMVSVQGMINGTSMKDLVEFVAITTDPERDTNDVLRDYGAAHGLDPINSTLLTSGADRPDGGREIAEAYGLKFTPSPDGMLMHGVVTHVIDKSGNLRARYHGLKFNPTNLVVYINALTNDNH